MTSNARLYWNEADPGIWQAVTASRLFEIMLVIETGRELYALEVAEGERFPENIGEYKSLDQAQRAAQRVFGLRGGEAVDPLGDALAREHPERLAAP